MLTARAIMEAREADRSREAGRSIATRKTATPAIREALLRVEGEYREMPGLSLTLRQAARLWGLDHGTCERVLTNLIERRILKRALNGTYVRR